MAIENYEKFLATKLLTEKASGFTPKSINPMLFDFQNAIVDWACRRGRAAIFANTGLGKTFMQVEWARLVQQHTNGKVIILAPLCVAEQTVDESKKLDVEIKYKREHDNLSKITITNYEMMDNFDFSEFSAVVLDESSIIKNHAAKTRKKLMDLTANVPYKLSCTATPSPNDFMELGTQSEWLSIMTAQEMLSMFFTHDLDNTQDWRLKGHAKERFWEWMSTWSMVIGLPSDLGFDDSKYLLPPLKMYQHTIESGIVLDGNLFPIEAQSLSERQSARKETIESRVSEAAKIINNSSEQWIVWCNLNEESRRLASEINGAEEVHGSQDIETKRDRMMRFTNGQLRVLVTKPSVAGFGLNWQHCHNVAFVGLSDSWEQYYQAIRRCYRFGQKKQVNVHIFTADIEGSVLKNIERKELQAKEMSNSMIKHMRSFMTKEINSQKTIKVDYERDLKTGQDFELYLGDCVDVSRKLKNESIDYCIFSPPFSSLYTYSNSERDMGNCSDDESFYVHFGFLVKELFRIMRPGRNLSFHCMNLPTSKQNHGFIGIRDFRGELIKLFQDSGFIYHSEVCIWKDPVVAMQRTKALGLLHKQIKKDSSMSRQGIPDYVVTMRKPGENTKPIEHTASEFPVSLWQKYASPIWMDIDQSKTLNRNEARDDDDERHICPLQLDVIERCMMLWSAQGDLVFSPFAGIGSEGYVALKMGRKFIGSELKKSYFNAALKNLESAKFLQGGLL